MSDELVPVRVVSGSLAGRDLARLRRFPMTTVRILFFPLFFIVFLNGVFGETATLPGFPARTLLDWLLPVGVVGACVTAASIPSFAMARDIQSGFFDRLRLAPVRPVAFVIAPAIAAACRALVPLVIVLALGFLAGVHLPGGPLGLLMVVIAGEGSALCASAWGIGVSLRLGTIQKAVRLMQLGNFFVVYLSTAQVPLSFMTGWLRTVARLNPMTYVLALARQGFIGQVTWGETWPGLLALGAGMVVLGVFAVRGLRHAAR